MKYLFLFAVLFMPCTLLAISDVNIGSKYIMIRKDFNLSRPDSISEAKFNEMMDHFKDVSGHEIKVGIKFIVSYFNTDVNIIAKSLERILFFAEKTNTPIFIKLDGEQWWPKRPDLWNWWDPNKPGYDPNNRSNVEWRWWGSEYALKICWRNWGRQLRVLPPPNLMSPKYRKACHEAMDVLMPIILNWYESLPEDKKFLFVGLNLGWESSIGINAFYYPNGDRLYDQPEENDPQSGAVRADVLSRGVVQQGYAAVSTAGIRQSGDITEEDLYRVIKIHLEDLCKYAFDFGFSRDKIISHGWGNESGELMYDAAVNQYSCPGWSEYWYVDDPGQDQGIMRNVKISDAPYWGVVEWVLPQPYEKQRWKQAISKTLSLPGCKMIGIYWWWFFDKNEEIHEAIREVCNEN
ncbi:MAG: hypothetical protein WC496_08180 [Phycisphaerae bacterium]|jgi:hypothetical protein